MASVSLVTALLLLVALLASAAELSRVSAPVVLVVAGLAIGFVPGVPHLRIEPDVVFLLFLPPLLYTAAFKLSAEDVRDTARPIAFLAIGLVIATIAAVAAVGHLVVGLPWSVAFVLGAVVGPTDPSPRRRPSDGSARLPGSSPSSRASRWSTTARRSLPSASRSAPSAPHW